MRRWIRWLGWSCLITLGTGLAFADTIKLKNGTLLDGDITAETPASISIEITFASGHIASTTIVPVSNIVEIVRLNPAQKRAQQLQRDVTQFQSYTLNSNVSYAVEYYDRVLSGVFRKFLQAHPGSPYEAELNDRIKEWQTERDRVATGQIRYNGEWMPRADFDKYHRWDQVAALLREGDQSAKLKNWPLAAHRYDSVLMLNPGGGTEIVAKRQLAASLQAWRAGLEREQRGQPLLRQRAEAISRQLSEITQIWNRNALQEVSPQAPATEAASAAPAESPEVLSSIATWFGQYWPMMAGAALLGLLVFSRLFR